MKTSVNFQSIIDEELVQLISNYYHVELRDIQPEAIIKGMLMELEHGTVNPITNISHDNLVITYKIALAHLMKHPDYYDGLEIMLKILDQGGLPCLKQLTMLGSNKKSD